jgi:hypothetical protein
MPTPPQLTDVTLRDFDGRHLIVSFTTDRPMPVGDTVLYTIQAWSDDRIGEYQLAVKYQEGEPVSHFVFDAAQSLQNNLEGAVVVEDNTVIATFPVDIITALGQRFDWSATLNVAGHDVHTTKQQAFAFT